MQVLGGLSLLWSAFRDKGEIGKINDTFIKDEKIMFDYNHSLDRMIAFSQNITTVTSNAVQDPSRTMNLANAYVDYLHTLVILKRLAITRYYNADPYLPGAIKQRWKEFSSDSSELEDLKAIQNHHMKGEVDSLEIWKIAYELTQRESIYQIMIDIKENLYALKLTQHQMIEVNDWIFRVGMILTLMGTAGSFIKELNDN